MRPHTADLIERLDIFLGDDVEEGKRLAAVALALGLTGAVAVTHPDVSHDTMRAASIHANVTQHLLRQGKVGDAVKYQAELPSRIKDAQGSTKRHREQGTSPDPIKW